jgi:hypothetical protein
VRSFLNPGAMPSPRATCGSRSGSEALRYRALHLAVDPRRPNTVYASAGAGSQSLYKTVDGAGRWRGSGPPGLRDNFFGHPIVVDRRAPGTIYAGGSRGLREREPGSHVEQGAATSKSIQRS